MMEIRHDQQTRLTSFSTLGQEGGIHWVVNRFQTNGSVLIGSALKRFVRCTICNMWWIWLPQFAVRGYSAEADYSGLGNDDRASLSHEIIIRKIFLRMQNSGAGAYAWLCVQKCSPSQEAAVFAEPYYDFITCKISSSKGCCKMHMMHDGTWWKGSHWLD